MRPLGLLIVWQKTGQRWEIMKTGLFGYYQNGVDYLNEFAQAKGWQESKVNMTGTLAYETGPFRIELSLVEATGVDLSKETYLFQELENAEARDDREVHREDVR
jgi:hypothetical protein